MMVKVTLFMVYGTLPIVRRTGGLADTVENYNQEKGTGTGFCFDDISPRAIHDTVGWAVWAYYNKKNDIAKMQRRGMLPVCFKPSPIAGKNECFG